MDPYIKIAKKFTKKFGSKVINRQYFHRKTGLNFIEEIEFFQGPKIIHFKNNF